MKTERLTISVTPSFKAYLRKEAKREKISVAELVRSRCERSANEDATVLGALTKELNQTVSDARQALRNGLREAAAVLTDLRKKPR